MGKLKLVEIVVLAAAAQKDTLAKSERRFSELDVIIKRLYEDNISGKLPEVHRLKNA